MPKIDLTSMPETNQTGYPAPFDAAVQGRWYRRIGPAAGLVDYGVSQVRLAPGAWSAQRHWHEREDEFLVMLAGEAVLVDDTGRCALRAGDCAAFPKGDGNGHHLINESAEDCLFIVVGGPAASPCHYPDIDLDLPDPGEGYTHRDGARFESR